MEKIVVCALSGRGGTYHYASELMNNYSDYFDVIALLPSYSNKDNISNKIKVVEVEAPPNLFKTIKLSFNFKMHRDVIKKINKVSSKFLNVVDIHPWHLYYIKKIKHEKLIVTIHDPEPHRGEGSWLMMNIIRFVTHRLISASDMVVALGDKQADILKNKYPQKKVISSRLGHSGFLKKTKVFSSPDNNTFLFFGRIKDYKGLDVLLDALILLKKEIADFKLIIAGEGDISSYSKSLSKLKGNVEANNKFISDDDLSKYFERSSFVVLPYHEATQTGIVPIAYEFERPVIATKVGSLPEVVINEKTGILIPPNNPKKLKESIKQLLINQDKAKILGKNAKEWSKENLDWKKIILLLVKNMRRSL